MIQNNIQNKLNDGAKAILNSQFEDYKNKIIDIIIADAINKGKNIEDITAKEILEIITSFDNQQNQLLNLRDKRKNYLLLTVSLLGITYTLAGFLLVMLSKGFYHSSILEILTISGSVLSFITIFYLLVQNIVNRKKIIFNKNRSIDIKEKLMWDITKKWSEIEKLALKIVSKNYEKKDASSIDAIYWLKINNYLNAREHEMLKQILNVRNEIVHNTFKEFDIFKLKMINNDASELINKLSDNGNNFKYIKRNIKQ